MSTPCTPVNTEFARTGTGLSFPPQLLINAFPPPSNRRSSADRLSSPPNCDTRGHGKTISFGVAAGKSWPRSRNHEHDNVLAAELAKLMSHTRRRIMGTVRLTINQSTPRDGRGAIERLAQRQKN